MNTKLLSVLGSVVVLIVLLVAATLALADQEVDGNDLAAIRQATARFHQVDVAVEAGFEPFLDCMSDPEQGGQGQHYVNFDLLDTELDALQPESIMYEPQANGQYKMVAVEYIVPADAWDEAGNSEEPSLLGHHFHLDEELGVYALHVWVWQRNTSGLFATWNPAVSCS